MGKKGREVGLSDLEGVITLLQGKSFFKDNDVVLALIVRSDKKQHTTMDDLDVAVLFSKEIDSRKRLFLSGRLKQSIEECIEIKTNIPNNDRDYKVYNRRN